MAEEEKKKDNGEKKLSDRQTKLVALTALLLAICATFSSLKAGGLSNAAILAQSQASDQWAYYQAKSLKENTYKVQMDAIKLHKGQFDTAQAEKIAAGYQRDRSLELRKGFSSGLTYLQIAILLASLTALVKQIMFWYASIVVGVIGAYYFFSTMMLM